METVKPESPLHGGSFFGANECTFLDPYWVDAVLQGGFLRSRRRRATVRIAGGP